MITFLKFADIVATRSNRELERAEAFLWFNSLENPSCAVTVSQLVDRFGQARLASPNPSRLRYKLAKSAHTLRGRDKDSFFTSREADQFFRTKYPEINLSNEMQILTPLSTALRAHIANLQSDKTQQFLEEAAACMEHKLYRAAIVLSWIGAISVMQEYVFRNSLDDFNQDAVANKVIRAPAKSIEDMRDISKESQFIECLCRISLIDGATKKILKECLDRRNHCGHPTEIRFGEAYVANHLDNLLQNVFARFA